MLIWKEWRSWRWGKGYLNKPRAKLRRRIRSGTKQNLCSTRKKLKKWISSNPTSTYCLHPWLNSWVFVKQLVLAILVSLVKLFCWKTYRRSPRYKSKINGPLGVKDCNNSTITTKGRQQSIGMGNPLGLCQAWGSCPGIVSPSHLLPLPLF